MNQLYKNSFDKKLHNYSELIDILLSEIEKSENNLKENLENIRKDFPNLTDHSLVHSQALWNYAQIIIGNNNYLNPFEAYILHMCFSILNNRNEIVDTDLFKDFIALAGASILLVSTLLIFINFKNLYFLLIFYCYGYERDARASRGTSEDLNRFWKKEDK